MCLSYNLLDELQQDPVAGRSRAAQGITEMCSNLQVPLSRSKRLELD
jgi:hypothetical protein